jgi:hypothetical protein
MKTIASILLLAGGGFVLALMSVAIYLLHPTNNGNSVTMDYLSYHQAIAGAVISAVAVIYGGYATWQDRRQVAL